MKLTPSDSACQKNPIALIRKNVEFCIFLPEERSQMRVHLFFSRGDRIDTVVLE